MILTDAKYCLVLDILCISQYLHCSHCLCCAQVILLSHHYAMPSVSGRRKGPVNLTHLKEHIEFSDKVNIILLVRLHMEGDSLR